MRILVAAFACRPNSASEDQIGWNLIRLLAKDHQVGVITHPIRQEGLEAMAEDEIPNRIHIAYAGKRFRWHPVRWVAQIQNRLIYLHWLREAQCLANEWLAREPFDLMHHATITTWRFPPVTNNCGIPLVWGPLGGAATFPLRLLPWLSPLGRVFESARTLSNQLGKFDRRIRQAAREASQILAVNQETASLMMKLGQKDKTQVHLLNAAFFDNAKISVYREILDRRHAQEPLRAFAGGFLVGSKGIHLALHSLLKAKEAGIRVSLTVASEGSEREFLEARTKQLGLKNQVVFCPPFQGKDYLEALAGHTLFLLPSFREGSAITVLEAMLSGQVPIVVKASTQGETVTPACGFAVPLGSAGQMISDMAEAILKLARDPGLRLTMAKAAHQRVAAGYSDTHFQSVLRDVYARAIQEKRKP